MPRLIPAFYFRFVRATFVRWMLPNVAAAEDERRDERAQAAAADQPTTPLRAVNRRVGAAQDREHASNR